MNSTSSRASSGCSAPASTPAYSTWEMQLSSITAEAGSVRAPSLKMTSAGGLDA